MTASKEVTGGVKSEVTRKEAMDKARVEVISGDGDRITRMDANELERHIEPQSAMCTGRRGWKESSRRNQKAFFSIQCSRSGVTAIWEDLAKEFQGKVSGDVQVTGPLRGNAFGQQRNVNTQTVPLNITINIDAGKSRVVPSSIVFLGDRNLVIPGHKMLSEVLASYVRPNLRREVVELSRDEKDYILSGRTRKKTLG